MPTPTLAPAVSTTRRRPRKRRTPNVVAGPERDVLTVTLPGGQRCFINIDDYHRLETRGFHGGWSVTRGGDGTEYVRVRSVDLPPPGQVLVARLIVGAMPGDRVGFRDGDAMNLRRGNLYFRRAGFLRTADRQYPVENEA